MLCPPDIEVDVTEAEGFRAVLRCRIKVFDRPEHPIEANNGEVDDVLVSLSFSGVRGVQDLREVAQDGEVCRVGSCARVILAFHGAEEGLE